jgi:HEPN domain-containing protein
VPLLPEQLRQSVSSDELALLNPYAVETRYPGFYEAISEGDARKAVEIAGRIRAACNEYLDVQRPQS